MIGCRIGAFCHAAFERFQLPLCSVTGCRFAPCCTASSEASGCYRVFAGSSPITNPRPRQKHTRSQGPFLRRHYPASSVVRPCPTPTSTAVLRRRRGRYPRAEWVSPDYPHHLSNVPCPLSRRIEAGASVGFFPASRGLPRYCGGSASASTLSRPAQASLALRPTGLLNRPRRPLSRGFDPADYPTKPLVSYQVLPTTSWVGPSSTGVSRRWGARRVEERRGVAIAIRFPSPLIERSMRISRTTLSDWFHRRHTTAGHMSVHHAPVRLGVATQPARKVPGSLSGL